jgi:flagellar hook assembly protein FlgD
MRMQPLDALAARVKLPLKFAVSCLSQASLVVIVFAVLQSVGRYQANQGKVEKIVEAERFVVRDQNGKKRAELGVEKERVCQSFFGKDGKTRLMMGIDSDADEVTFEILNSKEQVRFSIDLDSDGRIGLTESGDGADGDSSLEMLVEKDGAVMQAFFDKDSKQRMALSVSKNGIASIVVFDKEKNIIFRQGD